MDALRSAADAYILTVDSNELEAWSKLSSYMCQRLLRPTSEYRKKGAVC